MDFMKRYWYVYLEQIGDVQLVKNIPLKMAFGQQMKKEGHYQNY